MIKVSVFYSNQPGKYFDINYYCTKHIPMVRQFCGPTLLDVAVDHGVAGGAPGSPAPFLAMGHLYFETVDAFQSAFGPHTAQIVADVPNYTNIQPTIQMSEVKI